MNIEYNRKNNAGYGDIINYDGRVCILIFEEDAESGYECVAVDLINHEIYDGDENIEQFNKNHDFVIMGKAKDITLKVGD